MKLQDWGIIISGILAVTSLVYNVYKDFIQGPNLKTVINHFILMRLAEGNKDAILLEIVCDGLLSENKTKHGIWLLTHHENLNQLVSAGDRDAIKKELLRIGSIEYDITDSDIKRYIGHDLFVHSFYVPLVILNAGRKSGQISNIFLKLTSLDDPKLVWIYNCEMEIDAVAFSKVKTTDPSVNLISKIFPGISVAPFSSVRVDGYFMDYKKTYKLKVSQGNLNPGPYKMKVVGYDSAKKKILESNEGVFKLYEDMFFNTFKGTHEVRNLTVEDNITKEMGG